MSYSIVQLISHKDGSRSDVVKANMKDFAKSLKNHADENPDILEDHILVLIGDASQDIELEWSRSPLITVKTFISLYDNTILGDE